MLHERDLKNLALYLEKGKVVRIDVKDCGRKGREVLLEYEDGTSMPEIWIQHLSACRGCLGSPVLPLILQRKIRESSWREIAAACLSRTCCNTTNRMYSEIWLWVPGHLLMLQRIWDTRRPIPCFLT